MVSWRALWHGRCYLCTLVACGPATFYPTKGTRRRWRPQRLQENICIQTNHVAFLRPSANDTRREFQLSRKFPPIPHPFPSLVSRIAADLPLRSCATRFVRGVNFGLVSLLRWQPFVALVCPSNSRHC